MKDDYLWDGSGEADAETEQLEQLLGQFRHREQPLKLPQDLPLPAPKVVNRGRSHYRFATAAAIIIAVLSLVMASWLRAPATGSPAGSFRDDHATASRPSKPTETTGSQTGSKSLPDNSDTREMVSVNNMHNSAERRVSSNARNRFKNDQLENDRLELDPSESEAAAQVIMALQITGNKLSDTKKRIHAVYQHDGSQL